MIDFHPQTRGRGRPRKNLFQEPDMMDNMVSEATDIVAPATGITHESFYSGVASAENREKIRTF